MSLTPQWLDELRNRVSLSGVIGRSIRVQKAGREFKACCPFHNEKTPSFTINDEKGFYHCFGCGAHGDVIRWMTDHQGLPFIEAVKELAAQAGMDMPEMDRQAAQRAQAAKSLHDVMQAAQDFFVASLKAPEAERARAYLASRGFPERIAREFGFGYAPDSRTALKEALGQFPESMLIEAGLQIVVEGKTPYDRFRGRLMLPIADQRGRIIAFGGRILAAEKTDAPKYLNSPDTPLFDKGRTLYNLHRAAPAARSSARIVVVEGYMDVVALAAAGIAEAVAPLGTALTEHQIERLWRVTECPTLCFDGDAAGQRAAMKAVTRALPLLRPGHSLRIVTLPDGMDPDDVVKKRGREAMLDLLGTARSLVDVLWEGERDASPLTTPEDKAGLKARLLAHCDTIAHPDIKTLYRRELLDRFGELAFARRERPAFTPRQGGTFQPRQGRGPWKPAPPPLPAATASRLSAKVGSGDALLAAVLAGLVVHPAALARHGEALARVHPAQAGMAALLDALLAFAESGAPLESTALRPILLERQLEVPSADDYDGLRFGFLSETSATALDELAEAIELIVDLPAVESALARATERLENDFSEDSFAEQQRLLQRRLALLARLGQMGRTRASL
ncbi:MULTISPECIES: DNA primase [unclassified Novosphingobium]|uniref:DNA primase n=1 Tax=unclassified Novosphingobium TaxID=2644732 RepID=UPI00145B1486|nr:MULTISPECIES: DNA primase [unclassified Novosphingobium]MBB3358491.1 DNA primase [Novosphingobium sp. BK256]MBB3374852.1 DNA primase [Novosphingobium sp. BK280]MBB3379459.1 DNA primase [Novosphingobium sp. BK258]MBB3421154.1 DNA primase [Novosphingobium sp. BK267]MBB3449273.1 DNA primase [Novosphingobium sp. BK352]